MQTELVTAIDELLHEIEQQARELYGRQELEDILLDLRIAASQP